MIPATAFEKRALLVIALAVLATPVKANELWVAPAKNSADRLIADFAAAQKKTHFGFGVPDNFNGFTRATVLLIGRKDQEIRYDLRLSISQDQASDTAFVTEIRDIPAAVFKDQLLELDVSAIFNSAPALQAGTDYVSLSMDVGNARARRHGEREGEDDRNKNDSDDSGNPHALLFGLRFQYESPSGPTGPEGPTGPQGPQGPTGPTGPAGTLAAVMCPPGQVLRGINANGTPACVLLAAGPAPDTTPPTVTLVDPADLATGESIEKTIAATFSEAMQPLTITNLTFTVAGVTGTVAYDTTTRIATFTPQINLAGNTLFTATITTGVKDLAGNALAVNKAWSFTTGAATSGTTPVNLGTAAPFGALGAGAGITNQGLLTVVNGDIGTTGPSTTITGFHDGVGPDHSYTETPFNAGFVNGTVFSAPPPPGTTAKELVAQQALADANTAFLALSPAGMPGGIDLGNGELGGRTLTPGIYQSAPGTYAITLLDLTLDGQGDANAVWVFQMASSLTVGAAGPTGARSVNLINGAQAKNVFWQVGSAATINAAGGGTMVGTIIAQAGATFSTPGNSDIVTLNGRVLGLTASVTLANTVINAPQP